VQERAGNTLEAIGIGKDFLNRIQKTQQVRERIDKWTAWNLKLLHNKRNTSNLKRLSTEWEKIFASYTSDKGLITRIYTELKKTKLPKNQKPNEEIDKNN
jgi:hypothetical protein